MTYIKTHNMMQVTSFENHSIHSRNEGIKSQLNNEEHTRVQDFNTYFFSQIKPVRYLLYVIYILQVMHRKQLTMIL
jgi:hypothetical protein